MTAQDGCLVGQGEELALYAVNLGFEVASGQVGASDAPMEKGVTANQQVVVGNIERAGAWCMPGRVDETNDAFAKKKLVAIIQKLFNRRHPAADVQPELCRHVRHLAVGLGFIHMEGGLDPVIAIDKGQAEGMVEMGVCLEDVLELEAVSLDAPFERLLFLPVPAAGIHDGSLMRCLVP